MNICDRHFSQDKKIADMTTQIAVLDNKLENLTELLIEVSKDVKEITAYKNRLIGYSACAGAIGGFFINYIAKGGH